MLPAAAPAAARTPSDSTKPGPLVVKGINAVPKASSSPPITMTIAGP